MESASDPAAVPEPPQWVSQLPVEDPYRASSKLTEAWQASWTPQTSAAWVSIGEGLQQHLGRFAHAQETIEVFARMVQAAEDPESVLESLADPNILLAAIKMCSTSPSIMHRAAGKPTALLSILKRSTRVTPNQLHQALEEQLSSVDQPTRAAAIVRDFYLMETARIAHEEFVLGLSPDKVGRHLSDLCDVVIDVGLRYVVDRLAARRGGLPQRPDGSTPQIAVIALGNLGGQQLSYFEPLRLVFLYDAINHQNTWHRDFYDTVVEELVRLLRGPDSPGHFLEVDLRDGPRYEVGTLICSFGDALRIYETAGRTWQRLSFVKARTVAGSKQLGDQLLDRLQPWIFRQFVSRVELTEFRMLRHKLEKRAEQRAAEGFDVAHSPGGRDDLELTVQFLQLMHGGNLPQVRVGNTYEAIAELQRVGCLTHQESASLLENYARLCRLQHQLAVTLDQRHSIVPQSVEERQQLAWQLGIRDSDQSGDVARFDALLDETFAKNRKTINHLMLDAPNDEMGDVAAETELVLDPNPDPQFVESTLGSHGLADPARAMEALRSLSTETVPFLSPHRCRHFFASIAPSLLDAVSHTPDPDAALQSMVHVTDSLGAKATLWELLGSNQPTMELLVRLCSATPYLAGILTNNPGMIDELIDSLLMNRLPSAERLDAHSIELCRGAMDIDQILHSFKHCAHLTIGVRDILGKDTLEATHQAIGDTAEACIRRVIEFEQESLASQYGDPVDQDAEPAELVTLALGKLGGREPNYQSDLDAIFLYSSEGETRRRVGGHRATLSNEVFFNQLAQRVLANVNHSGPLGRLYELDSRLRDSSEEGEWAMSLERFLERFRDHTAPLWQRLAICRARAVSGSRRLRQQTDAAIEEVIRQTQWEPQMASEIRQMRLRMQRTARPENFKRGEGGTVDAEFVAQTLTLKHAGESPNIIQRGTTATLSALADAGHLDESSAMTLIRGYRTLRRVEAYLLLMASPGRHELPQDHERMKHLAFLMDESHPDMILAQCQQARHQIRTVFDQTFDKLELP